MQKFLLFFLLTVFSLNTTGAKLNIHYCGGKVKAISFFGGVKNCCGAKKMKKGCCKDKTFELKKADAKSVLTQVQVGSLAVLQAILPSEYPIFEAPFCFATLHKGRPTRPPPLGPSTALYLRYRSLLI